MAVGLTVVGVPKVGKGLLLLLTSSMYTQEVMPLVLIKLKLPHHYIVLLGDKSLLRLGYRTQQTMDQLYCHYQLSNGADVLGPFADDEVLAKLAVEFLLP